MIIFWCTYALVAGLLILSLLFVFVHLVNDPSSVDLNKLGFVATAFGVFVALLTFMHNLRRAESEKYLEKSADLLAKAYDILFSEKNAEGLPLNDRRLWLSAARMIKSAERIAQRITEESHYVIWMENREYWRIRFSYLFKTEMKDCPVTYFAEHPVDMLTWNDDVREPLDEKSIAIIYRFTQFDRYRSDPINNELAFTDEEIQHMQFEGLTSLHNFFTNLREIKEQLRSGDSSAINQRRADIDQRIEDNAFREAMSRDD